MLKLDLSELANQMGALVVHWDLWLTGWTLQPCYIGLLRVKESERREAVWATMAIFSITNKTNTNALIIDTPSTEKPWWSNYARHDVSRNCKMFQVNFIPSVAPDWKTAPWFFALCLKRSFLSRSVLSGRSTDRHVAAPVRNSATFLIVVPWTIRNTHIMRNCWK